jgi:beta-N-acetylhexosaminidase
MRLIRYFLLFIFLITFAPNPVQAQATTLPPQVAAILKSMTPKERVGQLFLVTFNGTDVSETSQIYDLMVNYHIGGVVLLAQNDNFAAAPDTLTQAHALIENLQQVTWDISTNPVTDSATGQANQSSAYVPLMVGIAQEGNGYPTDQILNGLTPLPSEMAIGATWKTDLAQKIGEVRGRELSIFWTVS